MASDLKTLEITLVSARDLKDVVTFGRMDPYCVVTISNSPAKQRTPTARNGGTNPVWNAKVAFSVQESQLHVPGATVVIQIMHDGSLGNTMIGTANIPLKEFLSSSGKHESTGYQVLTKSGRPKGYVNVKLSLMSGGATHGHPSQQLPFPVPPGSASAPAIPGPYSSPSPYATAPSAPHFMPSAPPPGAYHPQTTHSGPPPPGPAPYPAQPSSWESHSAKPEKPSSSSTGAVPYPAQPGMPYPAPPQQNGQAPVTAYPAYPGYPPTGAHPPPPHPGAYSPYPPPPPGAYPPPPPGAYPPQGYHQQPHYHTASAYAQRPHNSRYGSGHGGGVGGGALLGAGAGLLGGLLIGDMIGDAMDGDFF